MATIVYYWNTREKILDTVVYQDIIWEDLKLPQRRVPKKGPVQSHCMYLQPGTPCEEDFYPEHEASRSALIRHQRETNVLSMALGGFRLVGELLTSIPLSGCNWDCAAFWAQYG
ncbi:hypothetical protein M514_21702 [Trichuris suis]|uniref:Uncharacterized protein n=1 Tax=Trichuris suis TaxID=68888 RepID=A0A085N9P2_9BILA|nr:hypothetical protein M514_21702 [Trichuris suis]